MVEIEGYGGRYAVSPDGMVWSHLRHKWLSASTAGAGYKYVRLSDGTGSKMVLVHRLVAKAFLPAVTGKNTVNHLNGDKADNRAVNLEWSTPSEQQHHSLRTGLRTVTHKGRMRVPDSDISAMLAMKGIATQVEIAKKFNVTQPYVSFILSGRSRKLLTAGTSVT